MLEEIGSAMLALAFGVICYLAGRGDILTLIPKMLQSKAGEIERERKGWISVKNELPRHYGSYLVVCKGIKSAQIRIFEGSWDSIKPVTHWMPLPEVPKGE